MKKTIYSVAIIALGFASCTTSSDKSETEAAPSKDFFVSLVKTAFTYAMPLALMDMTRKK